MSIIPQTKEITVNAISAYPITQWIISFSMKSEFFQFIVSPKECRVFAQTHAAFTPLVFGSVPGFEFLFTGDTRSSYRRLCHWPSTLSVIQFRSIVGNSDVSINWVSAVLPDPEITGLGPTAFGGVAGGFAYFLEIVTGLTHLPQEINFFRCPR